MGNERSLVTLTLISNESKERAKSEFGSSSISGFFPVFVWRNPVLFCHVDAGTSIFNNGIFLVFSGYRVHLDETGKLHRYSRLEYSFGYINASSGVSLLLSKTAKVISSLYDLFGANDYFSFNKLLHFGRRILGSLGQLATTKVDLLSRAIAEIKFQKMPSTFLGKADKYIGIRKGDFNKNLSQFHAFLRGLISNLSLATKFYSSSRRPLPIVF